MGQTTDQIEAHIEDTRANLGANLQELERKVASVTDWKHHFQTNPGPMLGAALGGGLLIATMLGGRPSRRRASDFSANPAPRATNRQKANSLETWDNIKGAFIGVAATLFKDFVGGMIPGFDHQYQRAEEQSRRAQLMGQNQLRTDT